MKATEIFMIPLGALKMHVKLQGPSWSCPSPPSKMNPQNKEVWQTPCKGKWYFLSIFQRDKGIQFPLLKTITICICRTCNLWQAHPHFHMCFSTFSLFDIGNFCHICMLFFLKLSSYVYFFKFHLKGNFLS